MWFKQLSIYRLNQRAIPAFTEIDDYLQKGEHQFQSCMGLDWDSSGFIKPSRFNDAMVSAIDNSARIALKTEEKVLPSAVIKDILADKIEEIENEEGRRVGRKEKQELKDNITDDLLPRAFTKSSITEAIIDRDYGLLFINQANTNKAELLITKLRDALGGLEASLPRTRQSPGSLMTDWLLNGRAAGGFELDSDCELKGLGDAAPTVRMSNQDLTAEEVINHVKNGKVVTQLGLCWQDRVRFILAQDFTLKRVQFMDVVQEEAAMNNTDTESMMAEAQIIMTETLSKLIDELAEHLGGWFE